MKADNIVVLQVILANKVILVEGATEYIIMHDILENCLNENPDKLGIHVVSMGGNYYKRFKEISSITKNKILVITDNDESEKRIVEAKENSNTFFHVSMPQSIDEFTFEVSLYNANKSFFNDVSCWEHNQDKTVWKKHEGLDNPLVWLLEHKATAAFEYTTKFKNGELVVPDYITEGITWLLK